MPNWCDNSIAFYQEGGGDTAVLAVFYADVQRYMNYKDPKTGKHSSWIGHWLESKGIDTENLSVRCFFTDCELNEDHVRVDMESA